MLVTAPGGLQTTVNVTKLLFEEKMQPKTSTSKVSVTPEGPGTMPVKDVPLVAPIWWNVAPPSVDSKTPKAPEKPEGRSHVSVKLAPGAAEPGFTARPVTIGPCAHCAVAITSAVLLVEKRPGLQPGTVSTRKS